MIKTSYKYLLYIKYNALNRMKYVIYINNNNILLFKGSPSFFIHFIDLPSFNAIYLVTRKKIIF